MTSFRFELIHTSTKSRARVGRIHTPHGVIDTPNFVGVGTHGTMKAVDNMMVNQLGLQLMFCNTYHLLLQPGPDVVREAGGLHKFINRNAPIITDSGGFQVFSLAYGGVADEIKSRGQKKHDGAVLKITEEGVTFRSYRDGSKILLTPESSVETQKALGADIIIPLDELHPYHITEHELLASLERTHRWEKRSLQTHLRNPQGQAMYAVIHGGVDRVLRRKSCKVLGDEPFDGYCIGGSIGKDRQEMWDLVDYTLPMLPAEKPNHLLGIGDLESIRQVVPMGVDTFDSSYPTRSARHGVALTKNGGLKLGRRALSSHYGPIDESCTCPTCQNYTVAYLHHLFKAKETAGGTLTTIHNLHFMVQLMNEMREAILRDEI